MELENVLDVEWKIRKTIAFAMCGCVCVCAYRTYTSTMAINVHTINASKHIIFSSVLQFHIYYFFLLVQLIPTNVDLQGFFKI